MNFISVKPQALDPNSGIDDEHVSARLRVERAVTNLREGRGVIVTDDTDRENEGDFVFSAEHLTVAQMALMIREGSGIVCLVITDERAAHLQLPPMVQNNGSRFGTGFTVSIEAREGVATGVSAADRVTTVKAAISDDAAADDLVRPGHVFPLRCHPHGLMARRGHTEATIELTRLATLKPAGVLCEVTNEDGTMATGDDLTRLASRHGLAMVSIADLINFRLNDGN